MVNSNFNFIWQSLSHLPVRILGFTKVTLSSDCYNWSLLSFVSQLYLELFLFSLKAEVLQDLNLNTFFMCSYESSIPVGLFEKLMLVLLMSASSFNSPGEACCSLYSLLYCPRYTPNVCSVGICLWYPCMLHVSSLIVDLALLCGWSRYWTSGGIFC